MGNQKELREKLSREKSRILKEILTTKKGFNKTLKEQDSNPSELDASGKRLKNLNIDLENINKALSRLKEGIYGMCQDCGCEIPPERLAATQSPYCVACQEAHDYEAEHRLSRHPNKKLVPSMLDSTNPHSW